MEAPRASEIRARLRALDARALEPAGGRGWRCRLGIVVWVGLLFSVGVLTAWCAAGVW